MSNDSVCMCNTHYIYLSEWSIYVFITFLYFSVCLPTTGLTCSCSKSQEQNQCLIFLCATFNGITRVLHLVSFFCCCCSSSYFFRRISFFVLRYDWINVMSFSLFVPLKFSIRACSIIICQSRLHGNECDMHTYMCVCNHQFMCWFFSSSALYWQDVCEEINESFSLPNYVQCRFRGKDNWLNYIYALPSWFCFWTRKGISCFVSSFIFLFWWVFIYYSRGSRFAIFFSLLFFL